jgi:site-specific DNA-methyltransferase (cytosine-N4-specific)
MTKFYWRKYRYLPYEQSLARRELETLSGEQPQEFSGGLEIDGAIPTTSALQTTYFSEVSFNDGTGLVPLQAKLETSSNGATKTNSPKSAQRQSTRYSSHGLHEYRGKFNPQVVRVLGNILGLQSGDWLIDPFCGSGTSLLEARHSQWNAVGIDRNPLAIEIAKAKLASITISDEYLISIENQLVETLTGRAIGINFVD